MTKKTFLGACPHDCPDTCSMHVHVEDRKVVSVGGNPEHPFTKGRLCVKVNNYQDRVNSPERVLYPLKRVGPKGSGNFKRVGWDEALSEIKQRWDEVIDKDGASSILPYSYLGTQGIINGLSVGDPFFNRLGASISERTFCDSGAFSAYLMTIGASAGVDPESFVHSKYIILWACNTLSTNSHHWPFIAKAKKQGAKIVVIDPFKTKTALLADWHLPIRPGTDGALALAMMNVIIEEQLTDDDYIAKYTVGYEELKERVASYPPESVTKITGIPSEDIRQLAREFATTPAAVIRIGVAIERHAGGGQAVRAISCLPALTSAWRHVGGGLLHMPLWAFPINWERLQRPDLIGDDPRVINQWKLGKVLTGNMGLTSPINSLFVYNSNPVIVTPEQDKVIEGLSREDLFTVVSDQFITDTAKYADIILPATTQLEQEEIMFSWGHLYLSYNNKAIDPIGEAVSNSELFRRLAKTMGFDDDPYFVRDDDQMIKESLDWDAPALKGITLEHLKLKGFERLKVPSADVNAPHALGNFHTPSGKCEFKASLAAGGDFTIPLLRQGYTGQQSGKPIDSLPHFIPQREAPDTNPLLAQKYPFNIISPKSHAFLNSNYGNMKQQLKHAGDQTVFIHPNDATPLGIEQDTTVLIHNDRGRFQAQAKLTDDVMQGVLVVPMGYWRNKKNNMSTIASVNSSDFGDLGGNPTFSDTLVGIKAITDFADRI